MSQNSEYLAVFRFLLLQRDDEGTDTYCEWMCSECFTGWVEGYNELLAVPTPSRSSFYFGLFFPWF